MFIGLASQPRQIVTVALLVLTITYEIIYYYLLLVPIHLGHVKIGLSDGLANMFAFPSDIFVFVILAFQPILLYVSMKVSVSVQKDM